MTIVLPYNNYFHTVILIWIHADENAQNREIFKIIIIVFLCESFNMLFCSHCDEHPV